MGFCTKCGQELIDGQEHICPNQQPKKPEKPPVTQEKKGDTITIDIGAIKEKLKGFTDKVGQKNQDLQKYDLSAYEHGKNIVPDCIAANDGEVPIKQYNIARLRSRIIFSKAEGRLQITNKRIIFRASGRSITGRVNLHEEFKINELAGVEFRNRPEFNFLNFLIYLILVALFGAGGVGIGEWLDNSFFTFLAGAFAVIAIIGWIALAVLLRGPAVQNKYYTARLAVLSLIGGTLLQRCMDGRNSSYDLSESTIIFLTVLLAIIVLLALINLFMMVFVPNLTIKIKTKGAIPGIEIKKEEPTALLSILFGKNQEDNSGFLEILPWDDTDIAMREIGTIIDDIQTLGDAAIDRWQPKEKSASQQLKN